MIKTRPECPLVVKDWFFEVSIRIQSEHLDVCTNATKSMISNYGESVHYELKSNIDVTVWEPLCVSTSIHVEAPPGLATLDAK